MCQGPHTYCQEKDESLRWLMAFVVVSEVAILTSGERRSNTIYIYIYYLYGRGLRISMRGVFRATGLGWQANKGDLAQCALSRFHCSVFVFLEIAVETAHTTLYNGPLQCQSGGSRHTIYLIHHTILFANYYGNSYNTQTDISQFLARTTRLMTQNI